MTTTTHITTRFHLSLNVRDLRASVAFYRDLLGVEPDKLHERFARFSPEAPAVVLSLVEERPGAEPPGAQRVSHMGLRLDTAAALDEARQRLAASGRVLREEPESRCCYGVQDKVWITDPDGNDWEIYRLLADLEVPGEDSQRCCD